MDLRLTCSQNSDFTDASSFPCNLTGPVHVRLVYRTLDTAPAGSLPALKKAKWSFGVESIAETTPGWVDWPHVNPATGVKDGITGGFVHCPASFQVPDESDVDISLELELVDGSTWNANGRFENPPDEELEPTAGDAAVELLERLEVDPAIVEIARQFRNGDLVSVDQVEDVLVVLGQTSAQDFDVHDLLVLAELAEALRTSLTAVETAREKLRKAVDGG